MPTIDFAIVSKRYFEVIMEDDSAESFMSFKDRKGKDFLLVTNKRGKSIYRIYGLVATISDEERKMAIVLCQRAKKVSIKDVEEDVSGLFGYVWFDAE